MTERPKQSELLVQVGTPTRAPRVALGRLDQVYFQITGTLCNLTCTHCFISCSPSNHNFGFMDYGTILRHLEESRGLGVKEYYYTGGEPFMHPRILDVLRATLEIGPATVLTNGTLFSPATVAALAQMRDASIYSLELRVSIDAPDAAGNDAIRGAGSFGRAMEGVRRLVAAGFLPIITMAQTWDDADATAVYQKMRDVLVAAGYTRPRVKLMPALRIGAEAVRLRGYGEAERVTEQMMEGYDASGLICASARLVSDRGVHVCPILIEQADSVLGKTLGEAAGRDYALRHPACYTCYLYGAICSNASASGDLRERAREASDG